MWVVDLLLIIYSLQLAVARTDDIPRRRIFLYKVNVAQLVDKLPIVYKPWKFIAVVTRAVSSVTRIKSTILHMIYLTSVLYLFFK
jgi:hypothetical protein